MGKHSIVKDLFLVLYLHIGLLGCNAKCISYHGL